MKNYRLVIYIFGILLMCGGCDKEEQTGDLNLTINLQYQGYPLVMFQDFEYPDGRTINFSRFSFYTSDLKLDDVLVSDVQFHNLTDSHVDLAGATAGYSWKINEITPNTYSNINFGVGVNKSNNAMDPGVFDSGHPLAKPAEHWFSWGSFIFLKLEANMDTNGDGTKDLPISLHLGSDDAYRLLSIDNSIMIAENEVTETNLVFDIFDLLGGISNTYDIDANPQIHSLGQKDAVIELADNLEASIN